MEKRYKGWYETFEKIKAKDIPKINDMIIDLDLYLEGKNYNDFNLGVAKTEIEIYKAKENKPFRVSAKRRCDRELHGLRYRIFRHDIGWYRGCTECSAH